MARRSARIASASKVNNSVAAHTQASPLLLRTQANGTFQSRRRPTNSMEVRLWECWLSATRAPRASLLLPRVSMPSSLPLLPVPRLRPLRLRLSRPCLRCTPAKFTPPWDPLRQVCASVLPTSSLRRVVKMFPAASNRLPPRLRPHRRRPFRFGTPATARPRTSSWAPKPFA